MHGIFILCFQLSTASAKALFSGCPALNRSFVRTDIVNLLLRYLMNYLSNFDETYRK